MFSCPLRKKTPTYICMETRYHTWTASAHSSSSSGSVRLLLLAWADSTRPPTTQSTVYYRQVHNPLMFHYWFPCMLRLSVTPLPKMNSELTSHDPWDCCLLLACHVLPGTPGICYVMCCVVRGGPFSCASSPLSNLPGRVFDGVSCTHHA